MLGALGDRPVTGPTIAVGATVACGRADDCLGRPFAMDGEGHKCARHQMWAA